MPTWLVEWGISCRPQLTAEESRDGSEEADGEAREA